MESIGRTGNGNGAFVAVDAEVMLNLKVKRPVAEHAAALHAFAAPNAKILINGVLVIRLFDKFAPDSRRRAELIFRTGITPLSIGTKIAAAKIAVAAHGIGVETFHRRRCQDAMRRAASALRAFFRIDLPHHARRLSTGNPEGSPAEQGDCGHAQKITATALLRLFH